MKNSQPKEVFSVNVIECRGVTQDDEATKRIGDVGDAILSANIDPPIQAIITTFKDGTREVCCPHLFGEHKDCHALREKNGEKLLDEALGDKLSFDFPECPYILDIRR